MSELKGTFWDRFFEFELSAIEVEAYAAGLADALRMTGVWCGHCKSYDPLRIDEEEKVAHTYIFDLWDGGRHHPYRSLEQIVTGLRASAAEWANGNIPLDGSVVSRILDEAERYDALPNGKKFEVIEQPEKIDSETKT